MTKIIEKHISKILSYIGIMALAYILYNLFDYVPVKYTATISMASFAFSFLISLLMYRRHKNLFIPLVLLLYMLASGIEVQSQLYKYTDESYRLWNVGNWLVGIGFLWELIKMINDILKKRI